MDHSFTLAPVFTLWSQEATQDNLFSPCYLLEFQCFLNVSGRIHLTWTLLHPCSGVIPWSLKRQKKSILRLDLFSGQLPLVFILHKNEERNERKVAPVLCSDDLCLLMRSGGTSDCKQVLGQPQQGLTSGPAETQCCTFVGPAVRLCEMKELCFVWTLQPEVRHYHTQNNKQTYKQKQSRKTSASSLVNGPPCQDFLPSLKKSSLSVEVSQAACWRPDHETEKDKCFLPLRNSERRGKAYKPLRASCDSFVLPER